jgi:hypothetical protein
MLLLVKLHAAAADGAAADFVLYCLWCIHFQAVCGRRDLDI